MTTTDLSPLGVPGPTYTFAPKTGGAAKGAGPFTDLTPTATPGPLYTFDPKAPAVLGKGAGPFTELALYGAPGPICVFVPKTETEVTISAKRGSSGAKSARKYVIRTPHTDPRVDGTDDEDVLFILSMAIAGLIDDL